MASKNVNKKRKNRMTKRGEMFLYFTLFLILLAIPISSVYTKSILSKSNIIVEDLRNDIEEQEKTNESLKMEISELASLDTIQAVATEQGLTYQNTNIKVVTNEWLRSNV